MSNSSAEEKLGTKIMGAPAAPSSHPQNQKAATWLASESNPYVAYAPSEKPPLETKLDSAAPSSHPQIAPESNPYVAYAPSEKPPLETIQDSAAPSSHPQIAPESNPYVAYAPSEKQKPPLETILDTFNEWGRKAESLANNIWQNLKTGSSVSDAAWGKLSLGAKAMREGGFEALYKQTFSTHPDEKLKKTFACYLSTATGPVAGTLYLSNLHVAFCSDRPLCFTAPSGQKIWTYYKAFIPLANIIAVNPITMKENPSEKYIQLVTIDGHEFWFMGFVNYDKALPHLSEALVQFPASE